MLSFSIAVVNKVEIGLDQKLSMPDVSLNCIYGLLVDTAHILSLSVFFLFPLLFFITYILPVLILSCFVKHFCNCVLKRTVQIKLILFLQCLHFDKKLRSVATNIQRILLYFPPSRTRMCWTTLRT